jgi:hypothetical protein
VLSGFIVPIGFCLTTESGTVVKRAGLYRRPAAPQKLTVKVQQQWLQEQSGPARQFSCRPIPAVDSFLSKYGFAENWDDALQNQATGKVAKTIDFSAVE